MSQPNDNLKGAAQIEDRLASILAEQLPNEVYDEYKRFEKSINMHAGMAAAQNLLSPMQLDFSEKF